MQIIKKSLDVFFAGDMQVAVVKGKWGVGKTYFWNAYIKDYIKSSQCEQVAYSYISLFGKTSLKDVKQSIFHSSKPIKSESVVDDSFDSSFEEESKIFNRLPWIRDAVDRSKRNAPLLSWLTKFSKDAPFLKQYSTLIASMEYGMVCNYVVCIDDIERKSEALTVKEVMGLVDELAQRKSCKVILVFNEKSLDSDKDKEDFNKYREKVVDIELNYDPPYDENLQCVISSDSAYYLKVLGLTKELNIKNIRVIKKIKWVIDEFWGIVKEQEQRLIDEWLTHVVLFCWSYYKSDDALPFEFIQEQLHGNSWLSILSDEEKEEDENTKKYKSIATNLSLGSAIYDEEIIAILNHGFFDKEMLKEKISKISRDIESDITREALSKAWDIYSDSFKDNLEEFKSELRTIINSDIDKINLNDFSSAIDVLEEYGEDVTEYIEEYVKVHVDTLKNIDPRDSWGIRRIRHAGLIEKIDNLREQSKSMTIDEVALKIAINSGWNPEDIEFLGSLSIEDYFKWMMSGPEDITTKIRGGLLTFRNLQTSSEEDRIKYVRITTNVVEALKKVAATNDLNRKRVKYIYEVDTEKT
ncbi:MAG: P-loop NTPase fold protein [Pseudomonadales bacterium]|nr:P-loop NTPase fold protein [Pseudomonadales bacterium]